MMIKLVTDEKAVGHTAAYIS